MKKIYLIFYFSLVIVVLLTSCQPHVRFAENTKEQTVSHNNTSTQRKYIDRTIPINENTLSVNFDNLSDYQKMMLSEISKWLGTPYCYGGESHECTDCSGFVKNIYLSLGIKLPRTAAEQYDAGSNVPENERTIGDLVFFSNSQRISHVGIYIGNNEFVHASTANGVIRTSLSDDYYQKKLAGTRRIFNN